MRIAVDATDAFSPRLTGTGVYVRSLCPAMLEVAGGEDLTLLGIRSLARETEFAPPGTVQLLVSPVVRTVWSQIRLPLHLMRRGYDVVHFVDHKLPRLVRGRTVVTIHDTAFLRFPDTFLPGHRRRLTWFTRDAVTRADHVIAVSAATRDDLCTFYGVDPARISVIHHAVDHDRFRPDTPPVRRGTPYLLSVGALQPRKNYAMLMRAFRTVCARRSDRIDLIIIGQRGWLWEPIEREAREHPFADRIHLVGYVPDQELPAYYAGARAFLLPSLYEGFGIPVLEAMAVGSPVAAANVSALPEVVGDAGLLLDPADEEEWSEAILRLLDDDLLAADLRRRGLARAASFQWADAARATLNVYRACAHREPPERGRST